MMVDDARRMCVINISLFVFFALSNVTGEVMVGLKKDCALEEVDDDQPSAGKVLNLRAQCKYNKYREEFFYLFTWDPPTFTGTAVTKYRFYAFKGFEHTEHVCFQLPNYRRSFIFNESSGFVPQKSFEYAITPQPIKRDESGSIHTELVDADACPTEPKLKQLENVRVPLGSNVSFTCEFEETPFPSAQVNWYYSADKTNCETKVAIQQKNGITFSEDRHVLHIQGVKKEHVGCYVLKAGNGIGEDKWEKGYLELNASSITPVKPKKEFWEAVGPLFGLLIGTVVLVVAGFVVVMYKCLNTPKFREVVMPLRHEASKSKKIYISHCAEDEEEKVALAQFACTIKSWRFDVVIDVCCEVQISSDGGFSRWIPNNMKSADKVIVVITHSYLKALQSNTDEGMKGMDENIRKVNSEFNYITNILYNDLHYSKKVLLVAKGVKPGDFPFVFRNKFFIEFPEKLDADNDLHFRSIMGVLLEEEPLQLRDGLPHVLTHS